ncbi:CLUMA_CG012699, isoform A [Clunio marinus]|uniref:CLUMA_CG012699, isoform A n=1 Tax=Clunio marinus TaxID=568069 RepID=A0A1J1II72_9DIPT|nr:CLUMA_CG012699, isoform A [Clunio marinus]
MSEKELCTRDLTILELLFDKNHSEGGLEDFVQPVKDKINVKDNEEEGTENIKKSKRLEVQGIELTEKGKLADALMKFNAAIEMAPNRPSPYNNRAQLHRFMKRDNLAFCDLNKAIELSSECFPLTKSNALCQRGILRRKLGDDDAARNDFNESAQLGSTFARQQLIVLNPYAQLCNQMVTKLMTE